MIEVIATPFDDLITNYRLLIPLRNEDQLSLELVDVDAVEANNRIMNCRSYLQLNGQPISYPIGNGMINKTELDVLFNLILNYVPTIPKKYITVVKIVLGSKETSPGVFEIHPIFQPMVLLWNGYYPNSNNHEYVRAEFNPSELFQLDATNKFVPATVAEKNLWVKTYREKILIKHGDGENHKKYRDGVDVKEVVFPFQTIYTVMEENNSIVFGLSNCIQKIIHQETNPVKHAILISSPNNYPTTPGPFTGKYANRSHLCPPCNAATFGYDLA